MCSPLLHEWRLHGMLSTEAMAAVRFGHEEERMVSRQAEPDSQMTERLIQKARRSGKSLDQLYQEELDKT